MLSNTPEERRSHLHRRESLRSRTAEAYFELRKYDTKKCKLPKFGQMLGTSNNTFKPTLVQKFPRIKVYITLAVPSLLYGNEIWVLKRKPKRLLASIEINFFRTASYTPF